MAEVAPGYQISSTGTDAGTSRNNIPITTLAPRVTLHQENLHSVIMSLTEGGGLSIKDVTYPDEFMSSPQMFNRGVPEFKRIISAKILKYSALSLKKILLRLVSELDVEYERIDNDDNESLFAHPILIGGERAIEVITDRLKDMGNEKSLLEVLDEIDGTTNNGVICWRNVLRNLNNIITEKSMNADIYKALIKEADKIKELSQAVLLWEVFLNGGLDVLFTAINAVEKNNTIAYSGLAVIINDELITRLSPQQARVLFNVFEQAVIEFDAEIESSFFWNEKICRVILAIIKLQKEHIGVFNPKFVNRLCVLLEKRKVKATFRKSIIEILAQANVPLQKRRLVLQDTADILGDYFDDLVSLLPKSKADLQRTNTYLRKIKEDAQFFSSGVFQLIKDKKLTWDG
ncbi:MAG: hypothetical protein KKD05_02110 [Candidatus Omnitrophica bacterium]|nr:hypothetical protein [Candidatus Omnitrophota bacterium]